MLEEDGVSRVVFIRDKWKELDKLTPKLKEINEAEMQMLRGDGQTVKVSELLGAFDIANDYIKAERAKFGKTTRRDSIDNTRFD